MRLINLDEYPEALNKNIIRFTRHCNEKNIGKYDYYNDSDHYLLATLDSCKEISGVLPLYNSGRKDKLLEGYLISDDLDTKIGLLSTYKELYPNNTLELIVLDESLKSEASQLNLAYTHSEYLLTKNIKDDFKEERKDIEEICYKLDLEYGHCSSNYYNEETIYLYDVLIYYAYRNRGLGKELINTLIKKTPINIENVVLQVNSHNEIALKLYKSLGFEIKEEIPYYEVK